LLLLAALTSLDSAASAQQASEPSWRASALALVPPGYVAGSAYRTDETAMAGYLAVYPANADDPKSPGSTFAPRQALVVKLGKGDGALRALSAELMSRDDGASGNRDITRTDPDAAEDEQAELQAQLAAKRGELPAGTEPCDHRGWSIDKDRPGSTSAPRLPRRRPFSASCRRPTN
jgi:hypothetical protein